MTKGNSFTEKKKSERDEESGQWEKKQPENRSLRRTWCHRTKTRGLGGAQAGPPLTDLAQVTVIWQASVECFEKHPSISAETETVSIIFGMLGAGQSDGSQSFSSRIEERQERALGEEPVQAKVKCISSLQLLSWLCCLLFLPGSSFLPASPSQLYFLVMPLLSLGGYVKAFYVFVQSNTGRLSWHQRVAHHKSC